MNKDNERYILDTIEYVAGKVKENNALLKENNAILKKIIEVINYYISHSSQENEHDFSRNVFANMISNILELRGLRRMHNK